MSISKFVLVLSTFIVSGVSGQVHTDTLKISMDSAERLFIKGNYTLLAQKYNIQAQKAQEIQAKLYPNPNFSIFYSIYNSTTDKFFPSGPGTAGSEITMQLSQMIYLAGQRNKQVKIAQANTRLSEFQFYDLIRTLKYTLRTDFYNIYFLLQSASAYNEEISSLQQVAKAFEEQQGKGNIAAKEVIRIKAQLYTLLAEYNNLISQINDMESELRLVLQIKGSFVYPMLDSGKLASMNPASYPLAILLDSAFKNRSDLQIARMNVEASKLNYSYQKSLAVPNLTLAVSYDKQGSYVDYLPSLGAAIDLPFFNRNKGNIQTAKITTDANNALQLSAEATVQENVSRALEKAFANDKIYRTIDPKFLGDFDHMLKEVLINYERRNLTLLDFLDFYESYKQNILSSNNIQFNRISSFEDINFYTGTEFFNLNQDMPVQNKIIAVAAMLLFLSAVISCKDGVVQEEEKKGYILPDSLLKTIEIDSVSSSGVVNALTLTGKVDFNEDNVIKIFPTISGQVSNIKVMPGDFVKKGQELAEFRSSDMAGYSNDYVTAKSNAEIAKRSLDAMNDMYKSGLASQRDQLAAQEGYNQALSAFEKARRILNLNGGNMDGEYFLKSPIDGFVVDRQVNNQMMIRSDNAMALFTISDLKNVWVMANVYESNISLVKMGDSVDITTLSYPGRIFRGKIDKIMNVLDPANKVMKLRIVLNNPGYLLKPEMFANVVVNTTENKKMITIPSRALIFDHSQYYVLVYKSPSDITIRPVQVLNTVGDKTYISEGLTEGERLIGSEALLIYQELNS